MSNDTALFLVLREIKVSNQEVRILSDVEFVSNIFYTRVRDKKRLEKVGNLVKNSYLYR